MNATDCIDLARKHLLAMKGGMILSAELCLSDAEAAHEAGEHEIAKARAVKSLAYSVGILHADYRRAQQGQAI